MEETNNIHRTEKKEQIEKLINDFSNIVNSTLFGEEELKEMFLQFAKQHRTLQQSMFRVILFFIVNMTTDKYKTDGRNHYSKEIAKKLIKGYANQLKEDYLDENSGRGDEYFEKKAKELEQSILKNVRMYLHLPII